MRRRAGLHSLTRPAGAPPVSRTVGRRGWAEEGESRPGVNTQGTEEIDLTEDTEKLGSSERLAAAWDLVLTPSQKLVVLHIAHLGYFDCAACSGWSGLSQAQVARDAAVLHDKGALNTHLRMRVPPGL